MAKVSNIEVEVSTTIVDAKALRVSYDDAVLYLAFSFALGACVGVICVLL